MSKLISLAFTATVLLLSGTLITQGGHSLTTNIDFEKVSMQIYGDASPAAGKGGTTVDEVTATLKWKNRLCR